MGADPGVDLVALDDALKALARIDPCKVQVVEMRFFGGLSVEETATVLKVSPVTVRRERPLEERDAFLRHACAGDEPLERRVRALLSSEPGARLYQ